MADDVLKIRLDVLGKDKAADLKRDLDRITTSVKALEVEFKKGNITQAQATASMAAYQKELDAVGVKTKATVAAQATLWHAQNRAGIGFKSMATEVKSASMAAVNMNRILQDLPYGMIGIANNIEPLILSMKSVREEMAAAGKQGSALKVVLQSMLTTSGMMVAASGLIPLAMVMLPKLNDMLAIARLNAEALQTALGEAFKSPGMEMDPAQRRAMLSESQSRLKRMENVEGAFPTGTFAALSLAEKTLGIKVESFAEFQKQLQIERAIRDELQKQVDLDAARLEIRKRLGLTIQMEEMVTTGRSVASGAVSPVGRSVGSIGSMGIGSLGLGVSTIPRHIYQGVSAPEAVGTNLSGLANMQSSVMSIGNTLASSLAMGFQRGFQAGESFLGSFRDAVLAAMAQIAAQQVAAAGIAGILSLIPGVGTFGSIFSGLGGLFGGGSQSVGEIGRGGSNPVVLELNRIRVGIENMDLHVDDRGLAMSVNRGNQLNRRGMF